MCEAGGSRRRGSVAALTSRSSAAERLAWIVVRDYSMRMHDLGRFLVVVGAVAIVAGVVLMLAPRIPWLGRLPGDVIINRGPVTVYFPLVTSIVVSVVLTVLLNLFWRR